MSSPNDVIRWRQEISRQVEWTERGLLGTRLRTLTFTSISSDKGVCLRVVRLFTVPKSWISQSEALFTFMIFYDIKSLTWYPTRSWTVSKTRTFLQTLEMKITTEKQRNVKPLHLLNEKVICLTLTEKAKKKKFRAKIGHGYTGRRSPVRKNNARF